MSVNIYVYDPSELDHHHVSGTVYFINEYVVVKGIPIAQLLYAFGVCLVRTAPGSMQVGMN